MKIVKHVKIRIGEPLTAIASNSNYVIFGSITGYLGVWSKSSNEVYYVKDVFDELIRCITINESSIACAAVGDLHGLVLDCSDPEKIEYEMIKYDDRTHSPSHCASTIPFLYRHNCLLVPFPSTNVKELKGINSKSTAWLFDYKDKKQEDLSQVQFGEHSVPFCFDGKVLVWLDYASNNSKLLKGYDIATRQTNLIHDFSSKKQGEYISHVRLYKNKIIYVFNHKRVQILDLDTKELTVLYEHNSQIVLLEIFDKKLEEQKQKVNLDKEEKNDFFPEESKSPDEKKSLSSTKNNIDDLMIVTIDHGENFCLFTNREPMKRVAVRKLPGFPTVNKGTYLFDMGFPYYMSIDSSYVSFTSDIGLFALKYN